MLTIYDNLRGLDTAGILFRLMLAMLCGGFIGIDRGRKKSPAGFRTCMLVCEGAAVAMLLSQYENFMMETDWVSAVQLTGAHTDVSRYGAQVISGIGFLGTGTILVTRAGDVKGLTTAAGLWAAACMGLAVGAGFYEAAVLAFVLIMVCIQVFPFFEDRLLANARCMNFYVEMSSLEQVRVIMDLLKSMDIHIYEVEVGKDKSENPANFGAVFYVRFKRQANHSSLLSILGDLDGVVTVEEF